MQSWALSISRTFIFHFQNFFFFFLAVLDCPCCMQVFSSFGKQGLLSICSARVSHCSGFSCGAPALGCTGFSSCSTWTQSLHARGHAPGHVGSSQIRDQIGVRCTARQILNHWANREAPRIFKPTQIAVLLYRWMVNSKSLHSEEVPSLGQPLFFLSLWICLF